MNGVHAHILLVEDNLGDARLLRESISGNPELDSDLIHVQRVGQALAVLAEQKCDVVLLDLSLPDGHGLETVHRVKAAAATIPIVVLTANDDEQLAISAVKAGAQDYLIKGHTDGSTVARAIRYAIERTRAERLETERKSLQEAVRATEQVLGVLGHELRTPLASMRAIAELLLSGNEAAPDERIRFLRSMHDEVIRMTETINNMLEAARMDSGVARWNWMRFRLDRIGEEAIGVVRHMVDSTQVELSMNISPENLMMTGDADGVRRLIVNLVSNALKHTTRGKVTLAVNEMRRGEQRWVRFQVSDTGRGIPPDVAAKLGTAFALNCGVVGAAGVRGTGLGLAICKGIAAAHGGTISVRSVQGAGTMFTVLLQADLARPEDISTDSAIIKEAA